MMEAYKFRTVVHEDGVLRIPEISQLAQQEVEVFVVVPAEGEQAEGRAEALEAFLNKWRGILKDRDPDQLKSEYLSEKYQTTP